MRPRKFGRRSPWDDVLGLATTPCPRPRELTYQRFDQPVGLGSGVALLAASADQSSGIANALTSPVVRAAACPSSIQKLPYLTPRSSPPPAPGGTGGSEPETGGSCAMVRKVTL